MDNLAIIAKLTSLVNDWTVPVQYSFFDYSWQDGFETGQQSAAEDLQLLIDKIKDNG